MIDKNHICYWECRYACREIFEIACQELYDDDLNHLYTREYREKALEVCGVYANAAYVKKTYDIHLHDHYYVVVPEDVIDILMERAIYEPGVMKIGDIQYQLR